MKILVTGANGFIGSAIVEALLRRGHEVIGCARTDKNLPQSRSFHFVRLDMMEATLPGHWLPHLEGVSAVVNCAGVLREHRPGDFDRIHTEAPKALVEAAKEAGVRKFIQVSALGTEKDGRFVTTKHLFDEWLLGRALSATVIRPSVVVSLRGSYGGTSMLRALAALPGLLVLPGRADQRFQPVLLEDLVELVALCLTPAVAQQALLHAVGPEPITLRQYLLAVRAWLKLPVAATFHLSPRLVRFGVAMGERLGRGPLGATINGMLERGNLAPKGALEFTRKTTGWQPQSVISRLQVASSFVQDRWHARLYLLTPLIWFSLVLLWVGSGVSGLLAEKPQWQPILGAMGMPETFQSPLVLVTSVLDIALGAALFCLWRVKLLLRLMLVAVTGYSLILGVFAPQTWFDPLGGLLKNVPIIILLLVAIVLEEPR